MNRLKYLLFAFTAVLASCSLYLEEPEEIPEEKRGFDEAYHEVNDSVDVTYQFNDNVRVLSKRIQDNYLTLVEADSILYFSEYTPDSDLPFAGGAVFSDCTDKLPYGLCSRVLSVTRENGLVKVVTQQADIDAVFKKLKLNVDKYVDLDKGRIDDNQPDAAAQADNDSLEFYRSEEELSTPEARAYYNKVRRKKNNILDTPWSTRASDTENADDDDEEEIEKGKKDTPETSEWGITIDTRYLDQVEKRQGAIKAADLFNLPKIPDAIRNKLEKLSKKAKKFKFSPAFLKGGQVQWYVVADISRKNTEYVHAEIDTDNDLVEFKTIDETTWEGGIEVGVAYTPELNQKTFQPGEWLAKKTVLKDKPEILLEYEIDGPEVVIPLWGPLGLVINTSFTIKFSVEACGKVRLIKTTRKVTGTRAYKGEVTNIDEDETKKENGLKEASITGTAKLEMALSAGVGLRVGKGVSLDVTFGATITGGFEVRAYKNFAEEGNYGEQQVTNDNYVRLYSHWGFYIGVKIRAFFFTALDEKFPFEPWKLFDEKYTFFPQIDDEVSKVRLAEDEVKFTDEEFPKPIQSFWYTQKFKHVGIYVSLFGKDNLVMPFVRVYEGRSKNRVGNDIYPEEAEGTSGYVVQNNNNAEYHYHLEDLEDDKLYRLVPCINWAGAVYEYPHESLYFNSVTPYIAMTDIGGESSCYQVYGGYDSEYLDEKCPYHYLVACYPQVSGWSFIKKFGLHVKVYNDKGKCIINERLPIKQDHFNVYTVGIDIRTSASKPRIEVQPYAYLFKDGTSANLEYFSKELHKLNLSSSYGTQGDYDEFYKYAKILKPSKIK